MAQRPYTTYKGYRIYLPHEHNFSVDASGDFLVHVEFAAAGTGDHECMAIAGCVADSYEQACKLSVEQAKRILDRRSGQPEK